ncbi:MAG: hypothetical protein AAF004_00345 [Pseudomonadota bacterium]
MDPSATALAAATLSGACCYVIAVGLTRWHGWQQARANRQFETYTRTPPAATIDSLRRGLEARNIAKLTALGAMTAAFTACVWLSAQPLTFSTLASGAGGVALTLLVSATLTLVIRDARRTSHLAFASAARHAVAHGLTRVGAEHAIVHHDVAVDRNYWVDHVMLNVNGAFAIHVISPANRKTVDATLHNDAIVFDGHEQTVALDTVRQRTAALQHRISKPLGRIIPVRSVVVVAGCRVQGKSDDQLLVVSERDLVMIQGWRSASAALMSEDIDAIDHQLAGATATPRTLPAVLNNGLLSANA